MSTMALSLPPPPADASLPSYVTRRMIARRFGVHPATIGNWEKTAGFPPPIHVGRRVFYDLAKVREFIARLEGNGHAAPQPSN